MTGNTGLVFKMTTDLTNYSRGLKKAGSELDQFKNQMGKIGGAIAGAFTVNAIVAFGKEAVRLASEAEAVEKAFARIGGGQYMDAMRAATRGTVTDLELMKRAVMAKSFQIPLEQLGTLFEFARRRAEETGQSVDYLVNSIVTGIGRKSPLILDNLGISASALKDKLNGVTMEASSIGDVAAAVGIIARENLAAMGAESVTNQQSLAAITTEWQNMKLEIGKAITESETFKSTLSGIQSMMEKLRNRNTPQNAQGLLLVGLDGIDTTNLQQVSKLLEQVKATQQGLYTSYDTWIDRLLSPQKANEAKKLDLALNPLYQTLMKLLDNISQNNMISVPFFDYGSGTIEGIKTVTGLYGILNDKIKTYKEQLESANSESIIRVMREKISLLERQKEYYDSIGTSLKKMNALGAGQIGNKVAAPTMQPRSSAGPVNLGSGGDAPSMYELQATAEEASTMLSYFREDILATAAEGFGLLISGDMGLGDFFKSILLMTADFAKQFGKMLISIGMAKISLEKLGVSGIGAVIAGTALIAAASAIGSLLAKGPDMPGLATGTNYVPTDGPYFLHQGEAVVPKKYNTGNNAMPSMIRVVGNISGRDIRLTQARESFYNKRTTGN